MLMVLIQWCYLAAAAFLTGVAVLTPFQKRSGYRIGHVTSYVMAGILVLNVYAQYFSLFAGVSLGANALMVLCDLAAAFFCRRQIGALLRERWAGLRPCRLGLYVLLLLLFAYGSSRGYMHYDTGLYHAQSIRWIEEYGVVPGLANLHSRFGYNSAAFALCALFGGAGLTKYPLHCVQGFLALVCAFKCTALLTLPERRRVRLSDFLYTGCIFYLVAVFRELVAPASDYFAMLTLFFVLMCWTELLERKEEETAPYALLSLYLVYAATVKLSTAVLLVLALQPAAWLLKRRKWKQIALYILIGIAIALPYLARNVLISGWLFYPFTFFDIFPVDWKISKGYADSDAAEIRVYAKEIFDVYQKNQPFGEWFPNWLAAQSGLDKLLVGLAWAALPAGLVMAAAAGLGAVRGHRAAAGHGTVRGHRAAAAPAAEGAQGRGDAAGRIAGISRLSFMLLEGSAVLGFLFWQFGAPLVRYGYFYVLFLPLVTYGALYVRYAGKAEETLLRLARRFWHDEERGRERPRGRSSAEARPARSGFVPFVVILVAFLLYRGYNLFNMVLELCDQPYYIWQQDYGTYPAETYEVDGITIYVPTDRGQIGYDKFPSSPVVQDIELRHGTLESGFRKKN